MNKLCLFVAALCGAALVSPAVDHSMTGSNAGGTSSFNTGINWDDGQAPVAGNDYFTAGKTMRTPDGDAETDNHIFAGDSLTLNGGAIGWKSQGKCTINNLIVDGGSLQAWLDWDVARLYGNVWINSGKTWAIDAAGPNLRNFDIYSQISGPGNLLLSMDVRDDLASKLVMLHGVNTNFTGTVRFEHDGQLGFTDERALGPNPSSYTYNQLSVFGGWLYFTNSLAIDDANRGINLRANATDGLNGGGFDVADGATATVSCLINGAGDLSKQGAGKLVLATNETYTGNTYVFGGELNIAPGASILSTGIVVSGSSAVFSGTGVYDTVTLLDEGSLRGLGTAGITVDKLVADGGGIAVDPAVDDPASPRVTVTDSITTGAFTPLFINVLSLDTVQQSFKILDADDLADIAPHDLCVNPPWAGSLEIQNNGSGGKVLVLTTMPSSNIEYQIWSDAFGHSAFLETNWTDHLAPSAGKVYVNNAYSARTPQSGSHTFAGDRLIFDGTGLGMKGSGLPTVNDFVVMNNANMSLSEAPIGRIDGNVTLYPILASGRTCSLLLNGWTPLRTFHMYASLHGYGELRMFCGGDPAYGYAAYPLLAMNTNFFGRIRLDGDTNFTLRVTCEENIGGKPPAFRADQMVFNGGGISVTNDVAIDDPNRGITLMADGGVSGTSDDPGGYPSGTPAEERTYGGGAVFVADVGSTLTISCPITGPGDVLKLGEGPVVLSGNNSYTNGTTIAQGGLCGASANAFGTGPLRVEGEGRLLAIYSESMPANGVELENTLEFLNGGAVSVEIAEGETQPVGTFTVPICLLAEGETINAEDVPLDTDLSGVQDEVVTSTVGSRVLISVQFTSNTGTILLLR